MDISAITPNSITPLQPAAGGGVGQVGKASGQGFGELLGNLVEKVDGLQKGADASVADVVSGRVTDVHQVAVKVQEAGVAFDLMLGVRNRLMDAYNELMRMQL
ncbi:MAG: flagellar hook-basal body complex protein FliE [Pontiellaceae bacterium]|nr:flagellar hook-basal body complex protein FliE [Pontiellaceae bacterium]MBN2784109.1 flagellar hook-basal body complex protein FliE [Pontiellaceae bacterium]